MRTTLYWTAVLLFLATVCLPVLSTVSMAFVNETGGLSLKNLVQALSPASLKLLFKSVMMGATCATLSTLIGGVMAYCVEKCTIHLKTTLKILVLIPLLLSPYIFSVAWTDIFVLVRLDPNLLHSEIGVVFVWTLLFTPLAMLIIASGLRQVNKGLEEAGLMVAPYGMVLRKIILPLIKPSIMSSFVLVFILALSEFSVPAFFSTRVYATEIFTEFAAFHNFDQAVAHSLVLIFICIGLVCLEHSYISDAPFISIGKRSHAIRMVSPGPSRLLFMEMGLWAYIALTIILPLGTLLFHAIKGRPTILLEALHILGPSIRYSLMLATLGALFLTVLGLVYAYMSVRGSWALIDKLLLLTFAVPSMILGIGLVRFYNTQMLSYIYGSFWIIIIAYLGRFSFISQRFMANALKQLPSSLEEAAVIAGATPWLRLTKIVLPLIRPSVFGAFIVAFILCMGELGTTILVYPPGTSLLPIKVYTLMANAPQTLVSAMCTVVLIVTLSMVIFYWLIYRLSGTWR